jgi:hypothetical protein
MQTGVTILLSLLSVHSFSWVQLSRNISFPTPEDGNRYRFKKSVCKMMDNVQNNTHVHCNTPSAKTFRLNQITDCIPLPEDFCSINLLSVNLRTVLKLTSKKMFQYCQHTLSDQLYCAVNICEPTDGSS